MCNSSCCIMCLIGALFCWHIALVVVDVSLFVVAFKLCLLCCCVALVLVLMCCCMFLSVLRV